MKKTDIIKKLDNLQGEEVEIYNNNEINFVPKFKYKLNKDDILIFLDKSILVINIGKINTYTIGACNLCLKMDKGSTIGFLM